MSTVVEDGFMSQAETATMLNVGRNRVRRWTRSGFLPHFVDPETGRPLYSRRAIAAWQDRDGELKAERGAA